MSFNDRMEEIKLLNQYRLDSTMTGIKVHAEDASAEAVSAAKRLFDKGLVDRTDGGYLTDEGIEAAKHAQTLLRILAD